LRGKKLLKYRIGYWPAGGTTVQPQHFQQISTNRKAGDNSQPQHFQQISTNRQAGDNSQPQHFQQISTNRQAGDNSTATALPANQSNRQAGDNSQLQLFQQISTRVFNRILFREIFAKRKRNEFRNFVKKKKIFTKFRVSRKCHFSENKRNETKQNKTKQTKRNETQ
jgi:hypothetical protein